MCIFSWFHNLWSTSVEPDSSFPFCCCLVSFCVVVLFGQKIKSLAYALFNRCYCLGFFFTIRRLFSFFVPLTISSLNSIYQQKYCKTRKKYIRKIIKKKNILEIKSIWQMQKLESCIQIENLLSNWIYHSFLLLYFILLFAKTNKQNDNKHIYL